MAGPFSESQVIQQLDTWVEQITDATIEAEHLHSDAVSEEEWMEAIQSLKDKLTYARNNY